LINSIYKDTTYQGNSFLQPLKALSSVLMMKVAEYLFVSEELKLAEIIALWSVI
jgi:hypothetical protein